MATAQIQVLASGKLPAQVQFMTSCRQASALLYCMFCTLAIVSDRKRVSHREQRTDTAGFYVTDTVLCHFGVRVYGSLF